MYPFPSPPDKRQNISFGVVLMHGAIGFILQLYLVLGVAGLLWPDKVKDLCARLPIPLPSYRAIRTTSIGAIALSTLVFIAVLVQNQ
jgi:hypothetical protein